MPHDDVPTRPEVRVLASRLPPKRAAAYAVAALLVPSLFFGFATHTSKFDVGGQFQPIAEITQVAVPPGRIADLYVRVGDPVQMYQVLARVSKEGDGSGGSVVSFVSGTITSLAFKQGQTVPAGATLATISPDGRTMAAVLLVPSRALPHIKLYQPMWLRIDAFPHHSQKAGVVVQVDSSPISNAAPHREQLYRVRLMLATQTVTVDGNEHPITAGMRLQATVVGERRRLIELLAQPMTGAAAMGRAH